MKNKLTPSKCKSSGAPFSSGKGFGEGGDNLTNYPGSGPCSTYEKEI